MWIYYTRTRAYTIIYIHLCIHIVITSRENNAIYKCIMGNNYQQQCVQQCHYCNVLAVFDVWKSVTSCQRPRVEEDRWIAGASSTGRNTHPRIWSLGAGLLERYVYRVPIFFRHLNHRSQSFGFLDAISMAGLGQKITLDLDTGHWTYKVDHNYTPNHGEFLHWFQVFLASHVWCHPRGR